MYVNTSVVSYHSIFVKILYICATATCPKLVDWDMSMSSGSGCPGLATQSPAHGTPGHTICAPWS